MNEKKLVVLSAFRKFGRYRANASELAASRLNEQTVAGCRIHTVLFDCDIPEIGCNRGKFLLDVAREHSAVAVLSTGTTSLCPGFWFETRARNELHQKDYYPNVDNVPVDPNYPLHELLHPDLTPWRLDEFKREVEQRRLGVAEKSQDIGGYCCEHLIFQVLAAQRAGLMPELPYAFLHFPCCPEAVENQMEFRHSGRILLSVEYAVQGIEVLLRKAVF